MGYVSAPLYDLAPHDHVGKVQLVKTVIERLYAFFKTYKGKATPVQWKALEIDSYMESGHDERPVRFSNKSRKYLSK